MTHRSPYALLLFAAVLSGACAHRPQVAPAASPSAPAASAPDPTTRVMAEARQAFEHGEEELRQGHLAQARAAFDAALALYLEAPGGAYADERRAAAFRALLESIHLHDLEALAAGDGFDEALVEPAAIDELAALPLETGPASDETRRTAEAAVQQEENDLPIELNDAVLASIDLYQGRLREWFSAALARGGRYLPYIRSVFAAEGIPQDLAYTALVESAFKPSALSRAKARGVWQFIPSTGRRFGLQQDWWVDERSDPEKATRAAAQYLKELFALFGDWNLALAAYNAGEGKVQRLVARHGTRDFWELRRHRGRRDLRAETRNYVPMIHAAIVVAKAPETYGFSVVPEPELAYERHTVAGAVDLRTVAECVERDLDEVRLLNPQLRRMATPTGRSFDLKLPPGTAATLEACLERLPSEKRVAFRTHIVRAGQTLGSIARQYGTRSQDIAQANGIRDARRIARGAELIIPVPAARGRAPAVTPAQRGAASRPAPAAGDGVQSPVRVTHRVRRGDTLSGIAERYGTTVAQIQAWNGLLSTRIAAGGTLTIYTSHGF